MAPTSILQNRAKGIDCLKSTVDPGCAALAAGFTIVNCGLQLSIEIIKLSIIYDEIKYITIDVVLDHL